MLKDVTVLPSLVAIQKALKRIVSEHVGAPNHRKRILLDHGLADPDTGISDPVRLRTRSLLTGSTLRLQSLFENVDAALLAPVRLRLCRICQETGHNSRTCRQPLPPAPVDLTSPVVLPSVVGREVQNL